MLNAEIATQWIVNYLLGHIEKPSVVEMRELIEEQKKYNIMLILTLMELLLQAA